MVAQGDSADELPVRRGVKTKIFGFIIMALGVMDSLLTLRGGVPAYEFLLLIVLGAVIFAIGAVRGAQKTGGEQA